MGTRRGRRSRTGTGMLVAVTTLFLGACDFLDPTNVENPRTTTEDLAQADEPTQALLPGLRAQFARVISSNVVVAEVVSDNFSIHGTGLNAQLDDPASLEPSILNGTGAATGNYWNLQEMRALADFLLEEIIPGDESATEAQRAEVLYYRGMALVMMGENFSHAPLERDAAPVAAADLIARGIADLEASVAANGSGDFTLPARAGVARGYRLIGNGPAAVQAAGAVLSADPAFVFLQEYDANNLANQPYFFLVERQLQEMQPLPRLDFLDPKYTTRETGIPVAKAEEMHLILAEAALAGGNFAGGLEHLSTAIRVAGDRANITFNDADPRLNADLSIRPRSGEIVVRADPQSPFREGLVLERPGSVQFSPISGTSLDADSVAALPVSEQEAIWHAFHLARQEILFLEGRRMSDLGIRLPMMLREIDTNASISPGDPGTVVVVPGYIPPTDEMDRFTPASPYDGNGNLVATEVTIRHDLNRILAQNRVTPFN
jgi:hypothetical protein